MSAMATLILLLFVCSAGGVSVDPDLEQELPIRAESEDGLFVFQSMQMAGGSLVCVSIGSYFCVEQPIT